MTNQPWTSGPGEILRHGLDLLNKHSDVNRRLAMIAIDNSVELMMKTYLGLPKRITGIPLSRKEFADISESFPALLDALERHAVDKLDGVDLGAIEWFHRLRNQLYHQGNGLTVEREKVDTYAGHARLLFKNLFGVEVDAPKTEHAELFGRFMLAYGELEKTVLALAQTHAQKRTTTLVEAIQILSGLRVLDGATVFEIHATRQLRNGLAHGQNPRTLTAEVVTRLEQLVRELNGR